MDGEHKDICCVAIRNKRDMISLLTRLEGKFSSVGIYREKGAFFVIVRGGAPAFAGDYGDIVSEEAEPFIVEYADFLCGLTAHGGKEDR